ncbi:hypothetical protein JMJ77_0007485, partial [Colletotrichum scovillei]
MWTVIMGLTLSSRPFNLVFRSISSNISSWSVRYSV